MKTYIIKSKNKQVVNVLFLNQGQFKSVLKDVALLEAEQRIQNGEHLEVIYYEQNKGREINTIPKEILPEELKNPSRAFLGFNNFISIQPIDFEFDIPERLQNQGIKTKKQFFDAFGCYELAIACEKVNQQFLDVFGNYELEIACKNITGQFFFQTKCSKNHTQQTKRVKISHWTDETTLPKTDDASPEVNTYER